MLIRRTIGTFMMMAAVCLVGCRMGHKAAEFESDFATGVERVWIGPEYWANPLQDWRLNQGRIECMQSGGDRNVYLLTRSVDSRPGDLEVTVTLGQLQKDVELNEGYVGFKIGIRGQFGDYRDSAVRGDGYRVGMHTDGRLFIGRYDESVTPLKVPFDHVTLKLTAVPAGDTYAVTLKAVDAEGKVLSSVTRNDLKADWLVGGIALACSHGKVPNMPEERPEINDGNWGFRAGTERGGNVNFWFADWKVSGTKVDVRPECAFGPILFDQYTLSNHTMRMTAQMPPIGVRDAQSVALEIKDGRTWKEIQSAPIHTLSRTATFTVKAWDSSRDTPYRLVYTLADADGSKTTHYLQGTIRKDPVNKKELVVAAFTGNNDLGFPNNDFVSKVAEHNPDMLFFSGDQIYEGVGGYGTQTTPLDKACNDYLRKWYLYGWAYRDLLKDRPTVAIPDDHDVYHGNIWGAGGKATEKGLNGAAAQDSGGYKFHPEFVNTVHRTQTSHLPDPYDPAPIEQNISVYYCNMNYGGVSFAILADRMFKSAPATLLPEAKIWNGWPQNLKFDAKHKADHPDAQLLGDRQLKFLNEWAIDWRGDVWMKTVLSQTIFANLATLPKDEMSDASVPKLRILNADEYPPDDKPVSDFDSNGWPQTDRNKALRAMRRGFALHIAGDQHLGSTLQYGIEDYRDAGFAVCVPSVSNVWPRRWYPMEPGENPIPGQPRYTGDYEDGFGNKMSVHAVSNPVFTGLQPSMLYDRATGYGIVRFNRVKRHVTIEVWPRLADEKQGYKQYAGWPVTVRQTDNYNRAAFGYLPTLKIKGMKDAVVQVIREADNEVVYTIRAKGNTFVPKVFADGGYRVKVGNPDTDTFIEIKHLEPTKQPNEDVEIIF
ncbi:MAG: alkaline phosphatase D family protein [Phycisphaerae bacterium]|nr:alkaline phosphatase D family protein [Phycisphaerae bacterium]